MDVNQEASPQTPQNLRAPKRPNINRVKENLGHNCISKSPLIFNKF